MMEYALNSTERQGIYFAAIFAENSPGRLRTVRVLRLLGTIGVD
jgi:hypothetical protein